MTRTLGFFLGSAAVFAVLVYLLGQPVPLAPPAGRNPAPRPVAETGPVRIPLPARTPGLSAPAARIATEQVTAPADAATIQTPPPAATGTVQPVQDDPAHTPGPQRAVPAAQPPVVIDSEVALVDAWMKDKSVDSAGVAIIDGPEEPIPADSQNQGAPVPSPAPEMAAVAGSAMQWFALWEPFHSELSANAFARRLERVTGLDYRVINTGRAAYQVAVGYTNEDERVTNLALIEETTGLKVAGGSG